MMENKSLLQPLLSNNDDDQIVDLHHPVVTTATNYQPPYVPNNFANVLNDNTVPVFGNTNQGFNQSYPSGYMTDTELFTMVNEGSPYGTYQPQPQPQPPLTPTTHASSVLGDFLRGGSVSDNLHSFEVEETNFSHHFYKIQRRVNGKSLQRIKNGNITMVLKFKNKESRDQVSNVLIKVKRTHESKMEFEKKVGEVTLRSQQDPIQDDQILIQTNLDSVHVAPNGKPVYSLERTQTEFNFYHLIIEVHFKDNNIVKRNTKMFKLIGKEYKAKASAAKRRRENEAHAEGSSEYYSSGSGESPHSTFTASSPPTEDMERIVRAREVVAEHIQAKTLNIDGMYLGKMVTRQGDVAYHFMLKDDKEVFQEGEVIGFVKHPKNESKQVICKLDYKLASESILKGVVTRSQYLEARLPEKGVRSETICMLGIVPVQVIGSVHMNEPLYASPDRPGLAIGGHQLDIARLKEASFIGYSFSARKTNDETSVGVVEAAVGILQSASQCLITEKIRDIEEDIDEKFSEIKKENKNRRRCFIITAILTVIFLMLLGILLWQLYMPGSALRYYNCKLGRMKPHGSATFRFIPKRNIYVNPTVRGIQFTYEGLMKKMGYTNIRRTLNGTGYRYYLNIDRCAYGELRETRDATLGQKKVYGPEMFAVDPKCWHAYYYTDVKKEWTQYVSVSWPKKQNLFCHPEPPNREAKGDPEYPKRLKS